MLCVTGQEGEGVRKKRQQRAETALGARRASGKVYYKCAACDACNAAAESRKRGLRDTVQPKLFSDPGHKPIADGGRGFGGYVALRESCSSGGEYEIRTSGGLAQRGGQQVTLIWEHL
jgi:hypothetical protein